MNLRPYQQDAISAVNDALATSEDNPCIVLPTGAGKSLVAAKMIEGWKLDYPPLRVIILAHRKELIGQNCAEFVASCDTALHSQIGIYSAGLGRRDVWANILFAGIDSVCNKGDRLGKWDVAIIDECHRIPLKGEGKYRKFLKAAKAINPALRVVGMTATPYRLNGGPICHRDYILNAIAYEAPVRQLMDDGYLCRLNLPNTNIDPDVSKVKINSTGEFNSKQLEEVINVPDIVQRAVADALQRAEGRNYCIVFAAGVSHAQYITEELQRWGENANLITGQTPKGEREELIEDFKAGRLRWLVSVNVFFEGFNVKAVDCVAFFRVTASKCIWVQGCGRGMRIHPDKTNCLVLDYGGNLQRHGPIDMANDDTPKIVTCHSCGHRFAFGAGACPSCGAEIPKEQREAVEEEIEKKKRELRMHKTTPEGGSILNEPQWVEVKGVELRRHKKPGSPDSLRVTYNMGLQAVSEWVCPLHPGYAGTKGRAWLRNRGMPDDLEQVLGEAMFWEMRLAERLAQVQVVYEGKYLRVLGYRWGNEK